MTIKSLVVPYLTNGSEASARLLYYLKEFIKNDLGWTVAGSNDGTTAAFDGVDRLTTTTLFDGQYAWIVLTSPHTASADRVQLLISKDLSVNDFRGRFDYNPNFSGAPYSGGSTTTLPTATNSRTIIANNIGFTSLTNFQNLHLTGDDAAPYGFAAWSSVANSVTDTQFAFAFVPLEQTPDGAGKPYWVFATISNQGFARDAIDNDTTSTTTSHGVAEPANPPQTPVGVAGSMLMVTNNTGTLWPGATMLTVAGEDLSMPVTFGKATTPGAYFGISTFMLWNGAAARGSGTLFNGGSRVSIGDVNFPWDGSVLPLP